MTTENPILFLAEGNGSLEMRDRNETNSLTGSGAVRYAPAEGARTNLCLNARAASATTLWAVHVDTSLTRVTDADFLHGTAFEVSSNLNGSGFGGSTNPSLYGYAGPITISFDAKLVSGASDWKVHKLSRTPSGSIIGSDSSEPFTPTSSVQRFSMTWTPEVGAYAITPRFTRASAAASVLRVSNIVIEQGSTAGPYFDDGIWFDPITGVLGTPYYSPSVSRAVFWIEEGTGNFMTNPSFEVDTDGWTGGSVSLSRVTSHAYFGNASCAVEVTSAPSWIDVSADSGNRPAVSPGQVWTISAFIRSDDVFQITPVIAWFDGADGSGSHLGDEYGPPVTPTSEWQRVTFTGTAPASAASFITRFSDFTDALNVGDVLHIDAVQVEQKAYATSYCDGSLGTGYTWAGTAHASASTRAGSYILSTVDGRANADVGSMVEHARIIEVGNGARFMNLGTWIAGSGDDLLLWSSDGARAELAPAQDGVQGVTAVGLGDLTAGMAFVYAEWNGTDIAASVDRGTLGVGSRLDPGGTAWSTDQLIIDQTGGTRYIGPVAIYDRPLTDAELALVDAAIDDGTYLWSLLEPEVVVPEEPQGGMGVRFMGFHSSSMAKSHSTAQMGVRWDDDPNLKPDRRGITPKPDDWRVRR